MDTDSREITVTEMAVLDGTAMDVPQLSSNIIRVFLSSTFSDMTEERNMLLKYVYPRLKEYTMKKYGAIFQMVDMRWGVTNEVQNDHLTSNVCLNEIRNCQKLSVGPNFVALIGQKYGYRPIPAFIDAEEFELLRKQLKEHDEDLNILDLWYIRDDNAEPPQYVLQPINSVLKNYDSSVEDLKKASRNEWTDSFEEMRALLKKAAEFAFDAGLIGGQTKEKYFLSVTEEEIQLGMFENPGEVNKKCLCFIRTIQDLEEHVNHHRAIKFLDVTPLDDGTNKMDVEAQDFLRSLREQKIPERLNKENIVRLSTMWSDRGGINATDNADYLDKLAEIFYNKMVWVVDQNLSEVEESRNDDQTVEINQSLQIRDEWSRLFFGREKILSEVEQYLQDKTRHLPFVLYGESGCGKTAIIAQCARRTPGWLSKTAPATVVRFLGTSPRSSHILLTLQSLCTQICDIYRPNDNKVPSEYQDVVGFFAKALELPSEERPLVIYLDSLDQLSPSCDPYNLRWLPQTLPMHVKIVVSLIPDHFSLLKRFQTHFNQARNGQQCILQIPQLGDQLSIEILHARLKSAERTITKQQEQVIENLFTKLSLPLFSRIMFEEVRLWNSYTIIREHMVSASIKSALNKMFERLEMQHGRVLVHHALAYITAARDGVSEIELLDLLSLDDDVLSSIFLFWLPPVRRLPPFLWTKLKIELDKFLVVREAGDQDVLVWYHRQFREAAGERYLRDRETRQLIHENMAEYFLGTWGGGKKKPFTVSPFLKSRLALTTDSGEEDRDVPIQPLEVRRGKKSLLYNKRKLAELPYHLIRSGKMELALSNCVFNYIWLSTKLRAYGLQPVLEDLLFVNSFCKTEEVQTLNDALRIAGSVLNNFPDNLAIEIAGRLMDFYDSSPNIRSLIKQCDVDGCQHSALLSPFQLFDLPITALAKTLEGSFADISDMKFLKNGSVIASLYVDGSLRLWDIKKGEVMKELKLPQLKSVSWLSMRLLKSVEEDYLVCKGKPFSKNEICVVKMDTFETGFTIKSSQEKQKHALVVSKNYICVENALYDIRSGKKVHNLNNYRKLHEYVSIAITQDDVHILIGSQTTIDVFTITKAKKVKELPVTNMPSAIEITPDNRLAIVGQSIDCNVKVFDISIASKTFGQEVVTYNPFRSFPNEKFVEDNYATNEVSELRISNKGKAFVSLIKRKYPIVWSLKNVSMKPKLLSFPNGRDPAKYLFNIQFSADDSCILAAELSTNVMMWDASTGQLLSVFAAHKNDVHRLDLSQKNNIAATIAQGDTSMKFWDLQQFQKKGKLSTRKDRTIPAQNITFSNKSNLLFISRVQPLKSSKAYHFIDHFGIDVFDLRTGEMLQLLPFEKYGLFQNLAVSTDASVMVVTTGNVTQSILNIINLSTSKLIDTIAVPNFKAVKVSGDGQYMAVFTNDLEYQAKLYRVRNMFELGAYDGCMSGMFSSKGMFIGVTADRELLVRETMDDEEILKMTLQGDVKSLHYCDTTEVLLVTVDDGVQVYTSVFRTDGFGTIGTMNEVSKSGISDVASDGSICIDCDLQVFELQRCKRVKRLLTGRRRGDISSVRLSRNGEHAVFIDTKPTDCIKVCKIEDTTVVATCNLHCVPEFIEMIPSSNVVVTIGKNNSLFIMAIRDGDRSTLRNTESRGERLTEILGTSNDSSNANKLKIPGSLQKQLIENTKALQMKNFSLKLQRTDSADPNPAPPPPEYANKKLTGKSAACVVL